MSGVFDFAVRAESGALTAQSYRAASGDPLVLDESCAIATAHTGSYVALFALATSAGFHVSRFECRSGGPFGTLLFADDFSYGSLAALYAAGWSAHGAGASSVGSGEVVIAGGAFSDAIYRPTPAGTDTVIARGAYFGGETSPHWGMVSVHWNGMSDYGAAGYSLLMREQHPHNTELLECTGPAPLPPSGGGWAVGLIG